MNGKFCWVLCTAFLIFPALAEQLGQVTQTAVLRQNPAATAQAGPTLNAGTSLTILERRGGWYQVQTSTGQSGWLPLLQVRLAKENDAKGSSFGQLLKSNRAEAASGMTSGIRGISDEELRAGSASAAGGLQQLDKLRSDAASARQFASQGNLHAKPLPYAP